MSAKGAATAAVFAMLAAGCATVADRLPETVPLPYVSNFSDSTPGETVPRGWRDLDALASSRSRPSTSS